MRLLEGYAAYLRQNGFAVDVKPTNDLAEISRKAGVPSELQGCHTMFVDGYVIDGHVPIKTIRKLLSERPAIAGIALPGMPTGSPGMTVKKTAPVIKSMPSTRMERPDQSTPPNDRRLCADSSG